LQSDFGYPWVLDSGKRIVLQVNATCAGATTTAVAHTVESRASGLNPETRLVTLTVGGNDLGFAALAGKCLSGTPTECLEAIQMALGGLRPDLYSHLTALYGDVAKAAPNALIVVTGYLYLFESDSNNPIITAFNEATAALNKTTEDAVNATHDDNGVKIVYVDVTAAFARHGITLSPEPETPDPFINAPIPGERLRVEDFHPNAAGYNAYADAISDALPNGWLDKTSRSAASS
jgi:lysophospholipase L1-like esterase